MDKVNPYEVLRKLRQGETVICPECGKAVLRSTGDPTTSHEYRCENENCDFSITLD